MKSQTSMEFLSSIVVVMFFILAVYVIILGKVPKENTEKICKDIASAINSAVFFGSGFSQNVTVPVGVKISATNTSLICANKNSFVEILNSEKIKNSTAFAPFEIFGQKQVKNVLGVVVIE